jgi:DNA-directed RNA polymerase beta subunit
MTGQAMNVKIFIGPTYYQRLKHMVEDKMHSRSRGPIDLLTRQCPIGRSKDGGLRLGEMEQQALVAHGASLLLKERYDSDKVILPICMRCGSIVIDDNIRNKLSCPMCGSEEIEPVEMSYAFKLFLGVAAAWSINAYANNG